MKHDQSIASRLTWGPALLGVLLCLLPMAAWADVDPYPVDNLLRRFDSVLETWSTAVYNAASYLFWSLATISMVWTFSMMVFRRADFGELFAELVRFVILTGIFWWLLSEASGPDGHIVSILESMRLMGERASGDGALRPAALLRSSYEVFFEVARQSAEDSWKDADKIVGLALATGVVILIALAAVSMMIIKLMIWILAYGGLFLLGFGGAGWSSGIAVNYYKHVLAAGVSYFVMLLLAGTGEAFLSEYSMEVAGAITLPSLIIMLVASIMLLALLVRIPNLVASIVLGSQFGMSGNPHFSGHVMSLGGGAVATGVGQAGQGAQALYAAYRAPPGASRLDDLARHAGANDEFARSSVVNAPLMYATDASRTSAQSAFAATVPAVDVAREAARSQSMVAAPTVPSQSESSDRGVKGTGGSGPPTNSSTGVAQAPDAGASAAGAGRAGAMSEGGSARQSGGAMATSAPPAPPADLSSALPVSHAGRSVPSASPTLTAERHAPPPAQSVLPPVALRTPAPAVTADGPVTRVDPVTAASGTSASVFPRVNSPGEADIPTASSSVLSAWNASPDLQGAQAVRSSTGAADMPAAPLPDMGEPVIAQHGRAGSSDLTSVARRHVDGPAATAAAPHTPVEPAVSLPGQSTPLATLDTDASPSTGALPGGASTHTGPERQRTASPGDVSVASAGAPPVGPVGPVAPLSAVGPQDLAGTHNPVNGPMRTAQVAGGNAQAPAAPAPAPPASAPSVNAPTVDHQAATGGTAAPAGAPLQPQPAAGPAPSLSASAPTPPTGGAASPVLRETPRAASLARDALTGSAKDAPPPAPALAPRHPTDGGKRDR